MARPLGMEFEGVLYHVTLRGNARQPIFLKDSDRSDFLDTLAGVVERYRWICHAYYLMVETPEANLSRGISQLNGVYTQISNRRHGRVGHLFQGRFKAVLVEKESYLLELARYVVLNPGESRAGFSSQGLEVVRPSLEQLFAKAGKDKKARKALIYQAVNDYGYTLREMGEFLGLHYSTVSKAFRKAREIAKFKTCPQDWC